jgi:hypothetical protein
MDVLSTLVVRFHFNGQFVKIGNRLDYFGGLEAMSHIERDKVSLPEVVGHLKDHCTISEGALLHWLFPGKELDSGLRVLLDDNACIQMSDAIEKEWWLIYMLRIHSKMRLQMKSTTQKKLRPRRMRKKSQVQTVTTCMETPALLKTMMKLQKLSKSLGI